MEYRRILSIFFLFALSIFGKVSIGESLPIITSSTSASTNAEVNNGGDSFIDLPLDELLSIEITSVSKKEQKLSQAAAAIYVITGVYWDAQDTLLEDIERIEVIRGPGATLWRANAVNGVINIITKNSFDTNGYLLTAGAGNYEKGFAHARVGHIFSERASARAYLKTSNKGAYQFLSDQDSANDNWRSHSAGFRIDGHADNDMNWTLQGDIYQNKENQDIYLLGDSFFDPVIEQEDSFEANGWNILSKTSLPINNNTLTLQTYIDHTSRDEVYLTQKHDTFDIDLQYQFHFAQQHDIVMGTNYRYINSKFDNGQIQVIPDQISTNLYSAFIHSFILCSV